MVSSPASTARWGSSSWVIGAPKGQDRVAHEAGEGTFIAVDRRDQVLECAVHDVGPLLRVQFLGRSRGALDIAEEHRHDAAFALHPSGGSCRFQLGEQLLGDVLMEPALRGHGFGFGLTELMAAARTESRLGGELRSAPGTPRPQLATALHAELRIGGALSLTLYASHNATSTSLLEKTTDSGKTAIIPSCSRNLELIRCRAPWQPPRALRLALLGVAGSCAPGLSSAA